MRRNWPVPPRPSSPWAVGELRAGRRPGNPWAGVVRASAAGVGLETVDHRDVAGCSDGAIAMVRQLDGPRLGDLLAGLLTVSAKTISRVEPRGTPAAVGVHVNVPPSGNHLRKVHPVSVIAPPSPSSPVHARDTTDQSAHHAQGHRRRSRRSRQRRHPLGGGGRSPAWPPRRRPTPRPAPPGTRSGPPTRIHRAATRPGRSHRVPGRGTASPQHVAAEQRDDPTAGKNFVSTRLDTSSAHIR